MITLREALLDVRSEIEEKELPSSECGLMIDRLLNDDSIIDSSGVEVCRTDPVVGLDEPF